ncbi:type I-D CRISPR-associated helicase Cas3' [Dactylococcopsis salina]|uniref:type I-D CRISPR-associated helicase Cas3' n=1 Tax=Dactylococcopsis salina TaxID=292566 RepID=UPI0003013083|nr:type I-D CRISPR-associated helicase Cas3' [Dactylococcopsis salina]
MTGDGKSLAAFLSTLQDEKNVIALYPTNELARDQESQIKNYINLFQPELEPRVNRLSSAELELYAEQEKLKKASAIESRSKNSDILITNPDLLHYLHRKAYLSPYDNPDKLWNRIDKNFDFFIFDEFHVFSAPQIASVINTMLLIRHTNRNKKFLFLSATPDEQLIEKLKKAQFTYQQIDPIQAKKYQFPTTKAESKKLQSQHWRQVSREISLEFIPLESAFSASETWLKENKELILDRFIIPPNPPLEGGNMISSNLSSKTGEMIPPNPPSERGGNMTSQRFCKTKGAVILNSIAAVKRLVPISQELFHPYGLTVGENTGLSGQQTKLASLETDLVFGTSTIDIGVDFKINFLIFESSDTGNFIQRLGRLGRHNSFQRNGETIPFDQFTAYALVPKFLVERLFETTSPPLQVNQRYDRPQFNEVIRENYRKINNFQGYIRFAQSMIKSRLGVAKRNPTPIINNYPNLILHTLSDGQLNLTYHSIAENRGVLTNVVNNAVMEAYTEAGYEPLLYLPTGVIYLCDRDTPPISPDSLPQRVVETITSLCRSQLQAKQTGFGRDGKGMKYAEYYDLFFDEKALMEVALSATLRILRDGKASSAKKRSDNLLSYQQEGILSSDYNFQFEDDIRIDQLAEFGEKPLIILKRLVSKIRRFRNRQTLI